MSKKITTLYLEEESFIDFQSNCKKMKTSASEAVNVFMKKVNETADFLNNYL